MHNQELPGLMPTESGTSTEDEWPIKSPMSSREHVVPFSCCFLTGWLACLFTLPNPHILKNPTKRHFVSVISKTTMLFLKEAENLNTTMPHTYVCQGLS